MAAPEGSQFDARQFDAKMTELIQPVFVVDVASAIVAALKDGGTSMGKVYELGGLEIYTMRRAYVMGSCYYSISFMHPVRELQEMCQQQAEGLEYSKSAKENGTKISLNFEYFSFLFLLYWLGVTIF